MALPKWLEVLKQIGPYVLMAIPGVPPALVPAIVAAIGEAQQIKGASGADKRTHVINVAAAVAAGTNAVKPGTIDPVALSQAVGDGVDTVVDVVNVVHKKAA